MPTIDKKYSGIDSDSSPDKGGYNTPLAPYQG